MALSQGFTGSTKLPNIVSPVELLALKIKKNVCFGSAFATSSGYTACSNLTVESGSITASLKQSTIGFVNPVSDLKSQSLTVSGSKVDFFDLNWFASV